MPYARCKHVAHLAHLLPRSRLQQSSVATAPFTEAAFGTCSGCAVMLKAFCLHAQSVLVSNPRLTVATGWTPAGRAPPSAGNYTEEPKHASSLTPSRTGTVEEEQYVPHSRREQAPATLADLPPGVGSTSGGASELPAASQYEGQRAHKCWHVCTRTQMHLWSIVQLFKCAGIIFEHP